MTSDKLSARLALVLAHLAFLALPGFGLAQGGLETDLAIELVADVPQYTPPGYVGTFRFNVTNLGPKPIAAPALYRVSATPIPFVSGQGEAVFFIETPESQDSCFMDFGIPDPFPGDPLVILFSTRHPPLPVGETMSCEVRFWVNPGFDFGGDERVVDNQLTVEWQVRTINITDPNVDNDTISMTFRFTTAPIPTLGPGGMALLVVGIFVSFVMLRRRRDAACGGP